jgi:hypothetical protein
MVHYCLEREHVFVSNIRYAIVIQRKRSESLVYLSRPNFSSTLWSSSSVPSSTWFAICYSSGVLFYIVSHVELNLFYIRCPTSYWTRHFLNNFTVSQQLCALQKHATDTFLFISHTTNVLLFKFRFNIFIGVRIIKEMPRSVVSGTPYNSKFSPT